MEKLTGHWIMYGGSMMKFYVVHVHVNELPIPSMDLCQNFEVAETIDCFWNGC